MTCVSRQFFSFPQDFADVLYGLPQIFACVFCICSYFFSKCNICSVKVMNIFPCVSICIVLGCSVLSSFGHRGNTKLFKNVNKTPGTADYWPNVDNMTWCLHFGATVVFDDRKLFQLLRVKEQKLLFWVTHSDMGWKSEMLKKKWCHFPVMENVMRLMKNVKEKS